MDVYKSGGQNDLDTEVFTLNVLLAVDLDDGVVGSGISGVMCVRNLDLTPLSVGGDLSVSTLRRRLYGDLPERPCHGDA